MNSNSFHAQLLSGLAVLSVTGTLRACFTMLICPGFSRRALCVRMAARLAPAEEPPTLSLDLRLMFRWAVVEGVWSQRRASQQSCTAAGKGLSGASLSHYQNH